MRNVIYMFQLPIIMAMAITLASCSNAELKVNSMFTTNAVLQRDMTVPVWGTADENDIVTVEFRDQMISTEVKNGKWMVKLQPMKAGGPYVMKIKGSNSDIELRNIMVGEVWLCGGQSNMEWPLAASTDGESSIEASNDPMLRLIQIPRLALDEPANDVNAAWTAAKPGTVNSFSGVGYFFGRELRKFINVPIGLIGCNQGATMAEAWMPRDVLESDPEFKTVLDNPWPEEWAILRPTGLYNGMIHPIKGYAMRGVIWYQGESNAGEAYKYRRVFPAMIDTWRKLWGINDLHFLFTQLAPFEANGKTVEPRESPWAELRDAQLYTMNTVPNTGMAVITDAGDPVDIHPKDKKTVGERLSLIAAGKVYDKDIVYYGPLYKSVKFDGDKAIISFSEIGSGLVAKGGKLKGFAIAGNDKEFVWADAEIKRNKVIVSSPKVTSPVAVRYGWDYCPDLNLFNKEGIPASPFRTDDFQLATQPKQ